MSTTSTNHTLSPREVFDRKLRLAMAGDREEEVELFAPDAVVEFPFAPDGVPERFEGREQILAMSKALDGIRRGAKFRVLEDRSSLTVHETGDPEVVIAEIDAYVEAEATGEVRPVRQIHVYRIRDGRIVHLRDFFAGDTAAMVRQALAG